MRPLGRREFLAATAGATIVSSLSLGPRTADAFDLVRIGKDKWLFAGWESLTDPGDAAIQTTIALVSQASALFAQKGIGLLLVVVPLKARYYPSELPDGTTIAPEVMSRYPRVQGWLTQAGIKTSDLDAAITPVGSVAGQNIFFHTDQHWTAWSAEAAGAAIGTTISQLWPLPKPSAPPEKLGPWYSYQKLGDLAELLTPELQAQIGEETFVNRRNFSDFQTQDANGNYAIPVDPDVHIVGNSLSNPFLGLPQQVSNTLNRPVGLTWLVGTAGPWQTMLNFVESGKLKTPPKVVVWQMNEPQLIDGPDAPNFWLKTSEMAPDVWLSRMKAALSA